MRSWNTQQKQICTELWPSSVLYAPGWSLRTSSVPVGLAGVASILILVDAETGTCFGPGSVTWFTRSNLIYFHALFYMYV